MIGSKIDLRKEEFEELFNRGLSDYKIAKIMGFNHVTIFQYRKKHGYVRDSLKENKLIKIPNREISILVGMLLGDGSLQKTNVNTSFIVSHGPKQKKYCKHIYNLFKKYGAKLRYSKRKTPDKRNGKYYESYICTLPANPALNELYDVFYPNKIKVIPNYLFLKNKFTAESLAFLYMDDGNKIGKGYAIATMCFKENDILKLRKFLLNKFNIETTMFKDHRIYIKACSAKTFKDLVKPYMHKTMMYKL